MSNRTVAVTAPSLAKVRYARQIRPKDSITAHWNNYSGNTRECGLRRATETRPCGIETPRAMLQAADLVARCPSETYIGPHIESPLR